MNKKLILIIISVIIAAWAICFAVYMLMFNVRRNESIEYENQARTRLQNEQQVRSEAADSLGNQHQGSN